jgi:hypothetical protein
MYQWIRESVCDHGQGSCVWRRDVVARFDGGRISSDGGALLLGEVERRTGILTQFAGCFVDHRDEELVEHTVEQLVSQRVYGLALGYEDLNDHDTPGRCGTIRCWRRWWGTTIRWVASGDARPTEACAWRAPPGGAR